jgi:hypothetical protein
MKKQRSLLNFLKKLEKHTDNVNADVETLSIICKDNEYNQVSRTLSFLGSEIGNIRKLIWKEMEKYERNRL